MTPAYALTFSEMSSHEFGEVEPVELPLDLDYDGVLDINDNCIFTRNSDQYDRDGNELGDACDGRGEYYTSCTRSGIDADGDGIADQCGVLPTGRLHRAVRVLEGIGTEEADEVIYLIKESFLQYRGTYGDEGEPAFYLSFISASYLSFREDEAMHYLEKQEEALDLLESLVSPEAVEYGLVMEDLVWAAYISTQLALYQVLAGVVMEDGPLELGEGQDEFEAKLDVSLDYGLEALEKIEDRNYGAAFEDIVDSYVEFTRAVEMTFTPYVNVIGPEGGVIRSLDGLLEIEVPAGAFDGVTEVVVQMIKEEDALWDYEAYEKLPATPTYFLMSSGVLREDVTLRIPVSEWMYYEDDSFDVVFHNPSDGSIGEVYEAVVEDGVATAVLDSLPEGALAVVPYSGTRSPTCYEVPLMPQNPGTIINPANYGVSACISGHNFVGGLKWCGPAGKVWSHYDPYADRIIVTRIDYTTQEMLYMNNVDVVPIKGARGSMGKASEASGVVGASYGVISLVLWMGGAATPPGAFIVTCIGTGGWVCGRLVPPVSGCCVNRAVNMMDCNSGDTCDYSEKTMLFKEYYCDPGEIPTEYSFWSPMSGGTTAQCRFDKRISMDVSVLDGESCNFGEVDYINCRKSKGWLYRSEKEIIQDPAPCLDKGWNDEDPSDTELVHTSWHISNYEPRYDFFWKHIQSCGSTSGGDTGEMSPVSLGSQGGGLSFTSGGARIVDEYKTCIQDPNEVKYGEIEHPRDEIVEWFSTQPDYKYYLDIDVETCGPVFDPECVTCKCALPEDDPDGCYFLKYEIDEECAASTGP